MEAIIEVSGLKKSYGSVQAVKDISFYVNEGALFSFLGPNGAGKSTTIDILCTLLAPDAGQVRVAGHTLGKDDTQIRAALGVVFQDNMLDGRLTVKENLFARGKLYGLSRSQIEQNAEVAIAATGSEYFANRQYGKLSGGQRRRADIARALIHTPKVLVLDEPTTGLDPQTRKSVWEAVRALQQKSGMTVFLTTHYMEEAASSDYIIVIDDGHIAARGTPDQLKAQYAADRLRMMAKNAAALEAFLKSRELVFQLKNGVFEVPLARTTDAIAILGAAQELIERFEVLGGTMDDAFIGITGKEIRGQ